MNTINWDEVLLPYSQAVDELLVKLRSLANGFAKLEKPSPIEQVEGRVKKVSSILEKANRKGIENENILIEVEDIAGIRIICRFIGDIEKVIELIKNRSGIDLEIIKERDYITNIKQSGYRSYHLIISYPVITAFGFSKVKCEIQIRTLAMNFWATVEHSLRYKYKGNIPNHLKQRLVSSAEAAAKLDDELNEIRYEILEAQRVVENKTAVIEEIITDMQRLQYYDNIDEISKLNTKFYELYDEGNIDKLVSFNHELKVIRETSRI